MSYVFKNSLSAFIQVLGWVLCKDLKNRGKLQDTDPRLKDLKDNSTENSPSPPGAKCKLKGNVLFCKKDSMVRGKYKLPSGLQHKVIYCAHSSLGHLGVDKCRNEIGQSLHIKNLGRSIRNYIACSDLCKRKKHHTKPFTVEEKIVLGTNSCDPYATELSGSLLTSRAAV